MKVKRALPCLNIRYGEFPDILFGETDGVVYFDATHYAQVKKVSEMSVLLEFDHHFMWWMKIFEKIYGISIEDMIIQDADSGHVLFEESLVLLFIAYLDPNFSVYMLERISEMLINGLVLSDTVLMAPMKERFRKEDVIKFYGEG